MSQVVDRIRNGVNTEVLYGTLDAIKGDPSLGVFQFRAGNHWIDGAHNRSTIKSFYGAGQEDSTRREVFTLEAGKAAVFRAAAAALRPGGRLALTDIVSERELIERTRRNGALWAACIAGAVPDHAYLEAIEAAGLHVDTVRQNSYRFLSPRAQAAADKYGVTSLAVLATKA